MATTASNHRASLLSGLRTGGVRTASNPLAQGIPHTAAPGGSFNIPRFSSSALQYSHYPEEEEDQLAEMVSQHAFAHPQRTQYQAPMTAAVDGGNHRFMHQQQTMTANAAPFVPSGYGGMMSAQVQAQAQAQAQAMQMQMMQVEIMRLQALQAQQYQAELLAQAQRQQQQQQQNNRRMSFNPPATAGPTSTSFDSRASAPELATNWRSNSQAPMTAAIGGSFRNQLGRLSDDESDKAPSTPSRIISGGTVLGSMAGNGTGANATTGASKADGVSTWRRAGSNSVLQRTSSPSVKITPPPSERDSPPPNVQQQKARPTALNFNTAVSQPLSAVAVSYGEAEDEGAVLTYSSESSDHSSPLTPESAAGSVGSRPPLSPREEASRKLYEGLGIGRPAPTAQPLIDSSVSRIVSQAIRMPRGPPSGADELGPKNFATRIRRKAIGGLGALMDARERREVVEAF